MRYLVMSDIHGSYDDLKVALSFYDEYKCDGIIILGDELYHGPRNAIPSGYNPLLVSELLNTYKDKIIAIRGNCDAEVDQMLLEYSMMDDYKMLENGKHMIYLTHGHLRDFEEIIEDFKFEIFMFGHVHIPILEMEEGIICLNPGSIAIPKNNMPKCLAIMDEREISIYTLNHDLYKSMKI